MRVVVPRRGRYEGGKDPGRADAAAGGDLVLVDEPGPGRLFRAFRKRTLTRAVRVSRPFMVETLEGVHTGKAGDWLACGVAGELYPIDADVFAATYEEVTPDGE